MQPPAVDVELHAIAEPKVVLGDLPQQIAESCGGIPLTVLPCFRNRVNKHILGLTGFLSCRFRVQGVAAEWVNAGPESPSRHTCIAGVAENRASSFHDLEELRRKLDSGCCVRCAMGPLLTFLRVWLPIALSSLEGRSGGGCGRWRVFASTVRALKHRVQRAHRVLTLVTTLRGHVDVGECRLSIQVGHRNLGRMVGAGRRSGCAGCRCS